MTDVYAIELRQAAQASVAVDPAPLDGLVLTLRAVNGLSVAALPPAAAEDLVLALAPLWKGDKGDKGDQGDPGINGAGYEHVQAVASDEWTVNHNLGFRPSVTVLSPGGAEVVASVIHTSVNQFKVYFDFPFAGLARAI